ncbi:SURF1 family protein [Pseudomonas zhanjiangensis]|uniref:SURF1-like protein n=1 Tax=Pseudomonas zhanjiangensis TaxID=3239015 RepID=A0ABV3YMK5_9PSED
MSAFRPGLLPSLLVLALLPLLVGLGFWQLSRAEQKRELLASQQLQRHAEPIGVAALAADPDPAYRRVRLQGRFDAAHSLLLDNRTRDGRAGVELLQPFHDQFSGQWLLLNRGWLPWPDRRSAPRFTTPEATVSLTGWVYRPSGQAFRLQADRPGSSWPRLVTEVKPEALWRQLNRPGLRYEIRMEPSPFSFQVDWPVVAMSPDKHLGYAVQWFALAATLLGLFIYLGLHNARETRHESSHHPA